MIAKKEKQFIIFTLDDGKTVKYDLSTGKTYGKTGKEVKSITSQLRGYNVVDLIDSFADENYSRFLSFLNAKVVNKIKQRGYWGGETVGTKVSNIGTFLSKINSHRFFEQYFTAGISDIDVNFPMQIGELPKGFLKHARSWKKRVDLDNVKRYEKFSNEYGEIDRIKDDFEMLTINMLEQMYIPATYLTYDETTGIRNKLAIYEDNCWSSNKTKKKFDTLLNTYHYNKMSLLRYIDNIMYYEGVEPFTDILSELVDYNRMQSEMSMYKYEKYPKNFLTTHTITCRNYNRLTKEFPVEDFNERVDKDYEFKTDDFVFLYPNSPQEIKDEAVMQNNCVASYIEKVLKGDCHIMFLRSKDTPDKSLVTLEIRHFEVVQSKAAFNKDPLPECMEAIKLFNKHLAKIKKKKAKENTNKFQKLIEDTYIAPQKFVKRAV